MEISLIFAAFSAKIGAVKDKFVRLSTGAKKGGTEFGNRLLRISFGPMRLVERIGYLQVVAQAFLEIRTAQLANGCTFNLADAFTRQPHGLSHFF